MNPLFKWFYRDGRTCQVIRCDEQTVTAVNAGQRQAWTRDQFDALEVLLADTPEEADALAEAKFQKEIATLRAEDRAKGTVYCEECGVDLHVDAKA